MTIILNYGKEKFILGMSLKKTLEITLVGRQKRLGDRVYNGIAEELHLYPLFVQRKEYEKAGLNPERITF